MRTGRSVATCPPTCRSRVIMSPTVIPEGGEAWIARAIGGLEGNGAPGRARQDTGRVANEIITEGGRRTMTIGPSPSRSRIERNERVLERYRAAHTASDKCPRRILCDGTVREDARAKEHPSPPHCHRCHLAHCGQWSCWSPPTHRCGQRAAHHPAEQTTRYPRSHSR
jgi:hypothetical protein